MPVQTIMWVFLKMVYARCFKWKMFEHRHFEKYLMFKHEAGSIFWLSILSTGMAGET